jgi:hypothetical protein
LFGVGGGERENDIDVVDGEEAGLVGHKKPGNEKFIWFLCEVLSEVTEDVIRTEQTVWFLPITRTQGFCPSIHQAVMISR